MALADTWVKGFEEPRTSKMIFCKFSFSAYDKNVHGKISECEESNDEKEVLMRREEFFIRRAILILR